MHSTRRLLECVLDAYREGEWDECIRSVRTLVDASPRADASRQLLASLYLRTGSTRLALAQYRRLLPAAIERGGLFRALAFQHRIDELASPESLAPDRWEQLQNRLRASVPNEPESRPIGSSRPWTEGELIALPPSAFRRLGEESHVECTGLESWSREVETGAIWEILAGRLRWRFALPDGRASAERLAAEGEALRIEPELGPRAYLMVSPELPVEWLWIGAALVRDLATSLDAVRRRAPAADRTAAPGPRGGEPSAQPLAASAAPDPFIAPIGGSADDDPAPAGVAPGPDPAPERERRRHPRVAASFESRIALLRLPGQLATPIRGHLVDLSTSGLSARFATDALRTSRVTLADAVVALELDVPGSQEPLRLAGQVRWVEAEKDGGGTRVGIEFVLLTEPDQRLIVGALARVLLDAAILKFEGR